MFIDNEELIKQLKSAINQINSYAQMLADKYQNNQLDGNKFNKYMRKLHEWYGMIDYLHSLSVTDKRL